MLLRPAKADLTESLGASGRQHRIELWVAYDAGWSAVHPPEVDLTSFYGHDLRSCHLGCRLA